MRLVDNEVQEYIQGPGVDGIYGAIMSAAAICYQTDTEKIKKSPKDFVNDVLLANAHTRPLEFGSVYLKIPSHDLKQFGKRNLVMKYLTNPYSKVEENMHYWYVSTNYRVLTQGDYDTDKEAARNNYDKNWYSDLEYFCEPTEYHHERRTFSMWMSRGCTDDMRTHIKLSSMCESTRFCNYSKDKFGNELTWIKPYWICDEAIEDFQNGIPVNSEYYNPENEDFHKQIEFLKSMETQEKEYLRAAENCLQPQMLKRLFPLGVKAELRLCGFQDAWDNLFWRRCDSHADPECTKVSQKIQQLLEIQ